jgi:hypothetical protein
MDKKKVIYLSCDINMEGAKDLKDRIEKNTNSVLVVEPDADAGLKKTIITACDGVVLPVWWSKSKVCRQDATIAISEGKQVYVEMLDGTLYELTSDAAIYNLEMTETA